MIAAAIGTIRSRLLRTDRSGSQRLKLSRPITGKKRKTIKILNLRMTILAKRCFLKMVGISTNSRKPYLIYGIMTLCLILMNTTTSDGRHAIICSTRINWNLNKKTIKFYRMVFTKVKGKWILSKHIFSQ